MNASDPADPVLLQRGFVLVDGDSNQNLVYGDGAMRFFWQGDTAWQAPAVDHNRNDRWSTYLADRASRGYSVVLLAPSAGGTPDTSAAGGILFDDVGFNTSTKKCPGQSFAEPTWPKTCSRWKPQEWEKLDEKIRLANERGILVVLAGIMDPTSNTDNSHLIYPNAGAAQVLARNVAARLAGSHVIFSPSFDDPYAASKSLIDAVGSTLSSAAPRHLVTAHLAGGSSSDDYVGSGGVHELSWHGVEVFQSGHAYNLAPCGSDNQFQCAAMRARQMSSSISSASPRQPTFNGEAAYDNTLIESPTQQVDSPYGVRLTGYSSTLNGAAGFTLGVKGIWDWSSPTASSSLSSQGSQQVQLLGDQFRTHDVWLGLHVQYSLIKNQPPQDEMKASMASEGTQTHTLIYMPNNPQVDLDLSKAVEKGFSCTSSSWVITWIDPMNGSPGNGNCSTSPVGGATHRLTRPPCGSGGSTGSCDWLVTISKIAGALPNASAASPGLDVWTEASPNGRRRRLRARLKGAEGQPLSGPLDISAPGSAETPLSPVLARTQNHGFLVVWETDDDGSLHGIRAQRMLSNGTLIEAPFLVNTTTARDQSSPWVALVPSLGGLVTWTSEHQDGDLGGIFARRVSPDGVPIGPEIQVNQYTASRQDLSRVEADSSGNFVVAWTSWGQDGDGAGVYARRLDRNGNPLGPELRVNETTAGAQVLADVAVDADGSFTIRWESTAPDGQDQGMFRRRYDAQGNPLGGEVLVVPPTPQEPVATWPGYEGD